MIVDRRSPLLVVSLLVVASGCVGAADPTETALPVTTSVPATSGDAVAFEDEPVQVAPIAAVELTPVDAIKIANGSGGFADDVGPADRFGRDHAPAGDIDGDGVTDLIVGARSDDDGPAGADTLTDAGAAYVLFMAEDGTVRSSQKISAIEGGLTLPVAEGGFFGYGVAGVGDYNGDGVPDVAISAPGSRGVADDFEPSVSILHLEADGTVGSIVTATGVVAEGLSAVGDLDGDGRVDLVAADPDAGVGGEIQLLFFDERSELCRDDVVTIGDGAGGFPAELAADEGFGGRESALLGDLDGDGGPELAVGAFTAGGGNGAIWILSLDGETFEVTSAAKIAPGLGDFDETLPVVENRNGTTGGQFGHALVATGDLDGDGVADLITSANQHEDGVGYVVHLHPDKTVKSFDRITGAEPGFDLVLAEADRFGRSMSIDADRRDGGELTVYFGGGAGERAGGSIYALTFTIG